MDRNQVSRARIGGGDPASRNVTSVTEMTSRERIRAATILHDMVGAELALLSVQVESLARRLNGPIAPDLSSELDEIRMTIKRTASAVRDATDALYPSPLRHFGLVEAIRDYCDRMTRATGLDVRCAIEPQRFGLDRETKAEIYQIIVELIGNAVKYSAASSISTTAVAESESVEFTVRDNGSGVDSEWVRLVPENGAESEEVLAFPGAQRASEDLEARVTALGGDIGVFSSPGDGTTFRIRVPLREEGNE